MFFQTIDDRLRESSTSAETAEMLERKLKETKEWK
jgi:hypothetical protein